MKKNLGGRPLWIEIRGYLERLEKTAQGKDLSCAKWLKYMFYLQFKRSLPPQDKLLLKDIEKELLGDLRPVKTKVIHSNDPEVIEALRPMAISVERVEA